MIDKKDLQFICAQPVDKYFIWMVHLWLESLKNIGKSDKAIVLIFLPKGREEEIKHWKKIIDIYPEATFKAYQDTDNINKLIGFYIPILRPYILMKFFKEFPEMSRKAIFYCDCDILFTSRFNISEYTNDDTCYLSDCHSYISADYFDSKVKDVLPEKLEKYKEIDVLDETCKLIGITKEVAVANNLSSGGAQYLLKNITWEFWDKVITDCIKIRKNLQDVNREYFENESKGFQSWAADMWAVLWNLWLLNKETKIVPEMEFAWSSDNISKMDKPNIGILHNAGVVGKSQGDIPTFYKGDYHLGNDPLKDEHLYMVHNNEQSKTLANWYYVNELIKLKTKYNLNYN